ncbi:Hypothetical protein KVN_LOCUS478 [uncultured virus]|nr:Hypothetical protein KVN_LOCUS478 [uncultured virus]
MLKLIKFKPFLNKNKFEINNQLRFYHKHFEKSREFNDKEKTLALKRFFNNNSLIKQEEIDYFGFQSKQHLKAGNFLKKLATNKTMNCNDYDGELLDFIDHYRLSNYSTNEVYEKYDQLLKSMENIK